MDLPTLSLLVAAFAAIAACPFALPALSLFDQQDDQ
ncbi:hypothetical protein SAMN05660463_01598 [Pseudomonas sp. URIL14HWK12:I9]|nr:hypothetical protein F474_02994 [Pseudomonas sp. URIL14HWK12:I12]PVZ24213.1 hypothetical protein F470_02649 [Pseudomonas sp. URIL14HWK12:I10]PVZ33148.1 hypothetical protein F472_02613 [Pseudomonas sp. URIL14HWK12:I11]SNZ10526.1 hypothetical protein SAMN05660463_01598 [Pseudomonas sp. URIL14HWK12:I9]